MKKKSVFYISAVSVLLLYLFLSSTVIVKSGTVAIVNELAIGKDRIQLISRPLINENNGKKLFFKQPVIPGTGIGYIEEVYDATENPYKFKTSFALYTLDQLTGNPEDKTKVRAYTISGTIRKIWNWDSFLNKLNVDEVNSSTSPYGKKYSNRVEILADRVKFLLRTSNPEQYYPYGAGTKELTMNLGQKIDYIQKELLSRRNFLVGLKDRYNFPDEELYLQYLIGNAPWYWVFGIDQYENLINQAKNMREYEQSIFSRITSRRGNANKFINNEDYLYKINMIDKIHNYEENLLQNEQNLISLESYLKQLYRENSPENMTIGESINWGFKRYLLDNNMRLIDIHQQNLTEIIGRYIDEDLIDRLTNAINYEKLLINIEYIDIFRDQILDTYNYEENDFEEVDQTFNFIISKYNDKLEMENWENYLTSVNEEVGALFRSDPQMTFPREKIQALTNYKVYNYYLRNIESSLRRHNIGEDHNLYPIINALNQYPGLLQFDKKILKQNITNWFQNESAGFLKVAASIISYHWQLERTNRSLSNLQIFKEKELDPYILFESRNHDLDESELLWKAAIKNIMTGSDLSLEQNYQYHIVNETETIDSIGELYNVNPLEIFYENRYNLQFLNSNIRTELNSLLEYEDYISLYNSHKNHILETNQDVYIPGEEKYSENWQTIHESQKNIRKLSIDQYIYSNLEDMIEPAFYDFINSTDYMGNLEYDYGVEFEKLEFYIENRNILSNQRTGEIDRDFIDIYYQKTLR
ncbi:MAG: hypothetical protein JEY91_08640 [Spirochaetaceae bacterium]|nr:hypothetical protein [Spirochaetaceae bacterium]